jgi:putative oxidoreductase
MTSIAYGTFDSLTRGIGRRAIHSTLATGDSWTPTALRLVLAVIAFPHGAQKLLGWFGGYGFDGTMGYFTSLGIPYALGVLAILAETIGALALAAGIATRIAALGFAANMAVAALLVHLPHGFFMNWFGNQKGEGIEYFVLAIAAAATVMVHGGGRLSIDRALTK